jgi:hypothetical protein
MFHSRQSGGFKALAAVGVLAGVLGFALPIRAAENISPSRMKEIAALLPERAAGFGWSIANRDAWGRFAGQIDVKRQIGEAEKELGQPLPDQPDSLYLEFSKTGNRTHWQDVASKRRGRIRDLALAECLENKGRFIGPFESTVAALCAEKTWVMPAHDGSLSNFKGEAIVPDLGATGLAAEMAEADYLLGDRLSGKTRQLIREEVRRRVLAPFKDMIEGRQKEAFWVRAKMNWNAVCVGNTVFAALTLLDSREERAFYAAAGEHSIRYFLMGFPPDGYCAEGVGYWNYGFGHFILLTETLRRATGGKLDLMDDPKAVAPALFWQRSEVLPGVYPSISDCSPGTKPDLQFAAYVCRRLDLELEGRKLVGKIGTLSQTLMLASLDEKLPPLRREARAVNRLRSYFEGGGVLISRSGWEGSNVFAAVLKGGNNDEPHNHNDLGSFSALLGGNMLVCDPGGEVYTKRTFGPRRYESKVLSSFGHAVPVVAGQMQRTGAEARAIVLETNFTDGRDLYRLDLQSAYAVPELQKLERTFLFQRGTNVSLTVRDEVRFAKPETFEEALITWGEVKALDTNTLEIVDLGRTVRVRLDMQGRKFSIQTEKLDGDLLHKRNPTRIGVLLKDPIAEGSFSMVIEPEPAR